MNKVYYFDNAATTYPKPPAVAMAIMETMNYGCANPGRGAYNMSSKAYDDTKLLREKLLECAGSKECQKTILAPGATIAINMLLGGINLTKESTVYVSPFEHNSVMRVLYAKQRKIEFEIKQLPINRESMEMDLEKAEYEFCRRKPDLLCISHISNVTGYILPVKEICSIAKKCNEEVITVCDGCQAMGLIHKPLLKNDVTDFYIFAGHKTLYGPFGIGGIICNTLYSLDIIRSRERYEPYICGGTGSDSLNMDMVQESPEMLEAGSINILAVEGLLAALMEKSESFQYEKRITDNLVDGLEKIPGVRLYLPKERDNHIGIVSFAIEGYRSSEVGAILNDDYNIAVRTGYHCAPLIHNYLGSKEYYGTVRASVGRYTSLKEIQYFVNAVEEISQDW